MDEDILDHLRRQADSPRTHASFFAWYDRSADGKAVAEMGIVRTLLDSMSDAGTPDFTDPRPSRDQWPDCWAVSAAGHDTPFEVSELVDSAALPSGQDRPWSDDEIRLQLQRIIDKKDLRSLAGPGSRDAVLVVHTDEMYLDRGTVLRALGNHQFSLRHHSLARVFILFSYDPHLRGYPFIELQLAA